MFLLVFYYEQNIHIIIIRWVDNKDYVPHSKYSMILLSRNEAQKSRTAYVDSTAGMFIGNSTL